MTMNKQEFLIDLGLQAQTLDFYLERRWLVPDGDAFTDMDIARTRLIQDLKMDFGVNDEGVDVVLHLVDQLHGLRRALALLRRNV
jgi:chaperone modulatory protein CbpM